MFCLEVITFSPSFFLLLFFYNFIKDNLKVEGDIEIRSEQNNEYDLSE